MTLRSVVSSSFSSIPRKRICRSLSNGGSSSRSGGASSDGGGDLVPRRRTAKVIPESDIIYEVEGVWT